MRNLIILFLGAALTIAGLQFTAVSTLAQTSAPERAETLRAQLLEVETKQSGLQTRLQELEESLKPENIEKALAGVGSTHPEELRAQRRRELEIERNGVRAQLDLLATSHSRLEKAIARADAEAYRQSAAPPAPVADESVTAASATTVTTTPTRPRRAKKKRTKRSKRNVVQNPGL
jgi:septal ring factor EnvC (AmiA/AmiB activator)